MPNTRCILAFLAAVAGASSNALWAEESSHFARRVAPLLGQHCLPCHNSQKSRGGLDLSSRATVLKGGQSGPAVVPTKADRSLLIELVSGPEPRMPKQGGPLTREQIADLRKWVEEGARWPSTQLLVATDPKPRVGPDWWSLRPLLRPPLPEVTDPAWVQTPVDAFVWAGLDARGLRPSPPADRRTLIRRVTFDLHGLPPTPEEIDAFLHDSAPDAYERLIERLLASPRYGERWGRHWLDVVHYGDTHGYDKDKRRDHAWPYRDYVLRSFNADKPYARFVREQLAGDVLYPGDPDGIIATGFLAAGPWDFVGHVELREGTVEKEKTRLLDRDDMVANTVSTFLSLTAHCGRCHDHKFDPIPQKDYYRLQAVFAGVERGNRPYRNPHLLEQRLALEKRRKELAARKDRPLAELAAVEKQLRRLPSPDLVYGVLPQAPRPIHVLARGDVESPGQHVNAGALSCVSGLEYDFSFAEPTAEGSRRAALASWITDPKNVLTWRALVNRVWHYHFGRGLVETPNDFGWNGSRPTHPELLDWLAVEFRNGSQSLKHLHRLILRSATYRQSSRHHPVFATIDADNRFLWRMNRQRLDAESIRDAVLAVSGQLDSRMGGPGYELFRFKDDHSPVYDHGDLQKINDPATWRRTVYRFVVRSVPNPFLECLDGADPNLSVPVRTTTLTALQALALLNNPFMITQAELFAQRLRERSTDPHQQIEAAYALALCRPPSAQEKGLLAGHAARHGLTSACRLLFNANEFVFLD
jgi:hypothetical protein